MASSHVPPAQRRRGALAGRIRVAAAPLLRETTDARSGGADDASRAMTTTTATEHPDGGARARPRTGSSCSSTPFATAATASLGPTSSTTARSSTASSPSAADLPIGWRDVQAPGVVPARAPRRRRALRLLGRAALLEAPAAAAALRLWPAHERGEDRGSTVEEEPVDERPTAFFGVPAVRARGDRGSRTASSRAAATRPRLRRPPRAPSSSSPSTAATPARPASAVPRAPGPRVADDYDLRLTELLEGEHRFLVRPARTPARAVLARSPRHGCRRRRPRRGAARVTETAQARLEGEPRPRRRRATLLLAEPRAPRCDDVAERCLTCGNCTLVCPTCFCTTVEDTSDLDGSRAERFRVWDTCFSVRYSEMHGGNTRPLPRRALPPVADAQARDLARPVRTARLRRLRPLHHVVPRRHRRARRDHRDRRGGREMTMHAHARRPDRRQRRSSPASTATSSR